jgi:transposase
MRQKDPLRPLSTSERRALEQLARSHSAPALSVSRARGLLAVSEGCSHTEAAHLVGRSVGDSIAKWVARFNQVGLAAVERQAGGRPPTQYGPEERDRFWRSFGDHRTASEMARRRGR